MNRPATTAAPGKLRCAVYTRKSSDEGLEQSFNSLHAQREACEAYVLSQAGEGWRALPQAYDDGGVSGGTMERSGLQRLLADVDARRIDVVVVYKVDRLTRSLSDFARIVERFDAAGVSFVSVTQAFNTTTSMGRLTLNVLLSFAQFEREVTGERIRDKIAASKAKGMWMGGGTPLGYDAKDRTLKVNEDEAQLVRRIFDRYLALRSVHKLRDELAAAGCVSKRLVSAKGRVRGGVTLERGALFHLLSNRIYVGEIVHRDLTYPGLHPAIVERDVFDRVQLELAKSGPKRRAKAGLPPAPGRGVLDGRVFDDAGVRMTAVSACKRRGVTYRYYVSSAVLKGRLEQAGSLPRFPAAELEAVVGDRLARLGLETDAVSRVEVGAAGLRLHLIAPSEPLGASRAVALPPEDELRQEGRGWLLHCAVRLRRRGGAKVVIGPGGQPPVDRRAVDLTLVRSLARAESWKARLLAGEVRSMAVLAKEQELDPGYLQRTLRLAFLAPQLKRAIIEGRGPVGFSLQALMRHDLPLSWADQEVALSRL